MELAPQPTIAISPDGWLLTRNIECIHRSRYDFGSVDQQHRSPLSSSAGKAYNKESIEIAHKTVKEIHRNKKRKSEIRS
jgi:hypothetical protein